MNFGCVMALAMDFGRPESDKCQFNEHALRIANIHKHHINLIGVIQAIDKTSKNEQPLDPIYTIYKKQERNT